MTQVILTLLFFINIHCHVIAAEQQLLDKTFFVENEGAKLFCRSFGEGKPLIVLHGGPGLSQDYLLPQMTELAKTHQVIFYDQRGCGNSEGVISDQTITLPQYVRDLDAIGKACGFESFSLLGHSWGGFLAMKYAIAHPDQVEKLILSNSMPADSDDLSLFLHEWIKRMSPYMEKIGAIKSSEAFQEGDPQTFENYYLITFRTYCFKPECADLLHLKPTKSAAVQGQLVQALFNQELFQKPYDIKPEISQLKIPTLVIHGDFDPIPAETAEHLHKNIPHSQFVLLKDCGHFPYVETPKPYFKAIHDFLEKEWTH
jgi:proline iminopeptidase